MADLITYPEQGIKYDADDASGYLATRLSGVYSADEDFAVTAAGELSVSVSAGQAWVRPARFKGRSIIMEQPETITLTAADPVRTRIDRIVLRYAAAARQTRLQVLEGTPDSASPAPPDISRTALVYDLSLATITRKAGSTAITAADITDTRTDEAVCGVMRDGVTGIPTGTLVKQWQAVIEDMKNGSVYTRAEVDALFGASQKQTAAKLETLKQQVDGKISAATSIAASGANYIRFTDGTQICWSGMGNWPYRFTNAVYYSYFNFPVPFANTNYGIVSVSDTGFSTKSTTKIEIANDTSGTSVIVIGRWK